MDFSRIEGNEITGLSSDELSYLEFLTSSTDNVFNQHTGLSQNIKFYGPIDQFPNLSEDVLQELNKLEDEARNKNTNEQTKYYVKKFKDFLNS